MSVRIEGSMKVNGEYKLRGLLLVALALASNSAIAATPPAGYGSFESVCAVVQLEVSPGLDAVFVREELEYDLGRTVTGYFTSQGMAWPVELGSSCFPRNISTTSK